MGIRLVASVCSQGRDFYSSQISTERKEYCVLHILVISGVCSDRLSLLKCAFFDLCRLAARTSFYMHHWYIIDGVTGHRSCRGSWTLVFASELFLFRDVWLSLLAFSALNRISMNKNFSTLYNLRSILKAIIQQVLSTTPLLLPEKQVIFQKS